MKNLLVILALCGFASVGFAQRPVQQDCCKCKCHTEKVEKNKPIKHKKDLKKDDERGKGKRIQDHRKKQKRIQDHRKKQKRTQEPKRKWGKKNPLKKQSRWTIKN